MLRKVVSWGTIPMKSLVVATAGYLWFKMGEWTSIRQPDYIEALVLMNRKIATRWIEILPIYSISMRFLLPRRVLHFRNPFSSKPFETMLCRPTAHRCVRGANSSLPPPLCENLENTREEFATTQGWRIDKKEEEENGLYNGSGALPDSDPLSICRHYCIWAAHRAWLTHDSDSWLASPPSLSSPVLFPRLGAKRRRRKSKRMEEIYPPDRIQLSLSPTCCAAHRRLPIQLREWRCVRGKGFLFTSLPSLSGILILWTRSRQTAWRRRRGRERERGGSTESSGVLISISPYLLPAMSIQFWGGATFSVEQQVGFPRHGLMQDIRGVKEKLHFLQ